LNELVSLRELTSPAFVSAPGGSAVSQLDGSSEFTPDVLGTFTFTASGGATFEVICVPAAASSAPELQGSSGWRTVLEAIVNSNVIDATSMTSARPWPLVRGPGGAYEQPFFAAFGGNSTANVANSKTGGVAGWGR
jgi:hypothetical protein